MDPTAGRTLVGSLSVLLPGVGSSDAVVATLTRLQRSTPAVAEVLFAFCVQLPVWVVPLVGAPRPTVATTVIVVELSGASFPAASPGIVHVTTPELWEQLAIGPDAETNVVSAGSESVTTIPFADVSAVVFVTV